MGGLGVSDSRGLLRMSVVVLIEEAVLTRAGLGSCGTAVLFTLEVVLVEEKVLSGVIPGSVTPLLGEFDSEVLG